MKLLIESLKIRNFKGIKEQDIAFDEIETSICGENATGKTTVRDAFNWLLFEKDSQGRTQFEIKTLDEDGNTIHGLEHSVEGIFEIDGRPLILKKIYKEIWRIKKGDTQATFTGHKIERFINDVPMSETEFENRINELIDEKIFQLLTDPYYFSSMHWKERRKALFELVGEKINKEEIFQSNPELRQIESDLEGKTIEEFKGALKYQRKKLNQERANIPVKINTLHETIKEVDKEVVEFQVRTVKGTITKIEEQMLDATKLGEEQLKKQDRLYELKSKLKQIEFELKQTIKDPDELVKREIAELKVKIRGLEHENQAELRNITSLEKTIDRGNKELVELRKDYTHESEKKVEVSESIKECPTCKRAFPEDEVGSKIAELEENFKSNQVKELTRLREKGLTLGKEVKGYEDELNQAKEKKSTVEQQIEAQQEALKIKESKLGKIPATKIEDLLGKSEEYQNTKAEMETIEEALRNRQAGADLTEFKEKKAGFERELKELERDLHQEEINKETLGKIEVLMQEEKELSQKIGEIEKKELIADKYTNAQAELIERRINGKFETVSFRLFKKQTNGGLDDTCDVLVDGVPFDNANTAGQVNAGLDVINSLCRHYNIYTPIFIDNRESINDLIHTNSQLINLKVTRHKTLRIEQK